MKASYAHTIEVVARALCKNDGGYPDEGWRDYRPEAVVAVHAMLSAGELMPVRVERYCSYLDQACEHGCDEHECKEAEWAADAANEVLGS